MLTLSKGSGCKIAVPALFYRYLLQPSALSTPDGVQFVIYEYSDPVPSCCDLAIGIEKIPTANHKLLEIRYVLTANPSVYQQYIKYSGEAINHAPIIVNKHRPWIWKLWADDLNIDFTPKEQRFADSLQGVLDMTTSGLGLSMLPLVVIRPLLSSSELVRFTDKELVTNLCYAITPAKNELERELIHWLEQAIAPNLG